MKQYLETILERVARKITRVQYGEERPEHLPLYASATRNDPFLRRKTDALAGADKGTQILLALTYQAQLHQSLPRPKFTDVEFRCFSQFGEDGILLYIFSLIGTTNKQVVEICAGVGMECNAANLLINHGWVGLLFDGNPGNVRQGENFYARCQDTFSSPPICKHAWITAENVNSLIRENGFEGEIDLLSLDMDGVDYWIWKAIDCIRPRVVVLEYNAVWGAERAVTVPYRPDFTADSSQSEQDQTSQCYFGASLPAFVKLGREKGYRLVGCQRYGLNAFFIRSDIAPEVFPEIPASECFNLPLVVNYRWKSLFRDWPSNPLDAQLVEV